MIILYSFDISIFAEVKWHQVITLSNSVIFVALLPDSMRCVQFFVTPLIYFLLLHNLCRIRKTIRFIINLQLPPHDDS